MSLTRCDCISKELTQGIDKNIAKRFVNLFEAMCHKEKLFPQNVQRGLAVAQAKAALYFSVIENCNTQEVSEIMDEIEKILEKSVEKGVHFAVQAFALQLVLVRILGIDIKDL